MIGLLLLGQRHFGEGLIEAVEHTYGRKTPRLEAFAVDYTQPSEGIGQAIEAAVRRLDDGDGVLILADVYGATHTNIATRLVRRGQVELITGVNLPMLLRALNYRSLPMNEIVDKALSGGSGGIIRVGDDGKAREVGR